MDSTTVCMHPNHLPADATTYSIKRDLQEVPDVGMMVVLEIMVVAMAGIWNHIYKLQTGKRFKNGNGN